MQVTVGYKEIAGLIWDQLKLDDIKESVNKLKGLDWNPFNEDGDEFVGVWAEVNHNWDLVWDVAIKSAAVAQRVVVDTASLSNPEKHKAVVKVLDGLINAPWYIEPIDGLILDAIVSGAVKICRAQNWGIDLPEVPEVVTYREVG